MQCVVSKAFHMHDRTIPKDSEEMDNYYIDALTMYSRNEGHSTSPHYVYVTLCYAHFFLYLQIHAPIM